MPENTRVIGSEGLEQGGPDLGNDFSRKDLSVADDGDVLTDPPTMAAGNGDENTDYADLNLDDPKKVDEAELLSDYDDEDEFEEEDDAELVEEEDIEEDKNL